MPHRSTPTLLADAWPRRVSTAATQSSATSSAASAISRALTLTLLSGVCGCSDLLGWKLSPSTMDSGLTDAAVNDGSMVGAHEESGSTADSSDDVDSVMVDDGSRDAPSIVREAEVTPMDVNVPEGAIDIRAEAPSRVPNTVRGRLIDNFHLPVAGTRVEVGTQTARSDADGHFTVEGVQAPYDVVIHLDTYTKSTRFESVWAYRGLTIGEPVLQVLPRSPYEAWLKVRFDNLPELSSAAHSAFVALALPGCAPSWTREIVDDSHLFPCWRGKDEQNGTMHVLLSELDADALPTKFVAYAERPAVLVDGSELVADVSLSGSPPLTGRVALSVEPQPRWMSWASIHVHFPSGALMKLADERISSERRTITLGVPVHDDWKLRVGALWSGEDGSTVGYTHSEQVEVARSDEPPKPVSLKAPLPVTPIRTLTVIHQNESPTFQWVHPQPEPRGRVAVLVVLDGARNRRYVVVTSESQATLPVPVAMPTDDSASWQVELHGRYESVDEVASGKGFLVFPSNQDQDPSVAEAEFSSTTWQPIIVR